MREGGTREIGQRSRAATMLRRSCSSAMDGCWSFAVQRFRPPYSNPRAWGGRGEVGDLRRLATSADCSAGWEIEGRSPSVLKNREEGGAGVVRVEWLGIAMESSAVEERREAEGVAPRYPSNLSKPTGLSNSIFEAQERTKQLLFRIH